LSEPSETTKDSGANLSSEQLLERCFTELVRYYRYSSVGQRCTGIIHNMNTPLQVLSFVVDVMEQKSSEEMACFPEENPRLCQDLQTLAENRLKNLRQLRHEVDNLLSMSRQLVYQGMHESHHDPLLLDLNQIIQGELELYRANLFFKHRVTKKFRFHEKLPPISGYYIDFSQSFRLLVDNALEAMENQEPRELHVETALEQGHRLIRIGDSGSGIPQEALPFIFEPFFTTKGTPEKPRAGLGLFMVKRLLAPYRAQITITSRPGETWATVRLPL